eukprot:TRINITY_DN2711_c0_g1_i2.p1 TRINITY_DN2711_c0_g1~~TRINITY_DN2711_c0_g1_i2.p1  ORF type:complete len:545 (+),score=76.12 TRINITY_DN2711_c0_g1_i2:216-1637(+)
MNAEIFSMTKEKIMEKKEVAGMIKKSLQEFDQLWEWLKHNKKGQRDERAIEYEAFALLRVCTRYTELDKVIFFQYIDKAKKLFKEVLAARPKFPNMISTWGLGMSMYLHGAAIEPSSETKQKVSSQLFEKAHELMSYVVCRLKISHEEGMDRFIQMPHYYFACVYAGFKHEDALFWLTKAKVKGGLPGDLARVLHDFRHFVSLDSELEIILGETLHFSKERLAFMQDHKKQVSLLSGIPMMEMSLTASQLGVHGDLTASAIMSDSLLMNALSTSTLHFLTDGHFNITVNLKHFLEPVKTTEQVESERRLRDRLTLYGLEPKRDIPGDGNCQMYSLSHQLTGDIKHAKFVRRSVVGWLRRHADLLLPNGALLRHFVYDKEWESYCNEMAKDGSWGDHLTLIAAAEVFSARIVIVSSIPGDNYIVDISPIRNHVEEEDGTIKVLPAKHLLTLSHYAEFHYGSVHPIDNTIPFQSL